MERLNGDICIMYGQHVVGSTFRDMLCHKCVILFHLELGFIFLCFSLFQNLSFPFQLFFFISEP